MAAVATLGSVFERLDGIVDDLAAITRDFDGDRIDGRAAQRVVCAAADIERFATTLKTLAVHRVDESGAWRTDGSRSPGKWLAHKTGTSLSDAYGTVELSEQLEQLPQVNEAARQGVLSPVQTRMIAGAASRDPASEGLLLKTARQATVGTLKKECQAARRRGAGPGAMAQIHGRRSFRDWTAKRVCTTPKRPTPPMRSWPWPKPPSPTPTMPARRAGRPRPPSRAHAYS